MDKKDIVSTSSESILNGLGLFGEAVSEEDRQMVASILTKAIEEATAKEIPKSPSVKPVDFVSFDTFVRNSPDGVAGHLLVLRLLIYAMMQELNDEKLLDRNLFMAKAIDLIEKNLKTKFPGTST